jgi:FKBP-type peptidyl-prolyl cis-trans isomerase
MINKFEAIGIFLSVGIMALALFLMRMDSNTDLLGFVSSDTQSASVVKVTDNAGMTLKDSMDLKGNLNNLVVDDIVIGTGAEVASGDTITVNYIGTLQNGQQFDNSYIKGEPFSFTVGAGRVIKGWELGVVGMKVGGQRILVVPADLAYGDQAVGPIPANATLVFAIELIDIK